MQKVKAVDYEVLARFLSYQSLYEVKWKNHIIITVYPDMEHILNTFWMGYTFEEAMKYYDKGLIFSHARTVRDAWKKAYKVINK